MRNISKTVINGWSRAGIHQFDVSFFRLCANNPTKEWSIEDAVYIKNVMVEIGHQKENRIVSLYFDNCDNKEYEHLKESIQEAKNKALMDYAARHNRYLFRVEFDSDEEISCGGDISISENMSYVDETNNAIVFVCSY